MGEKLGVMGCGSWATTIAKILAENGHDVLVWCHRDGIVDDINSRRSHTKALPGIILPDTLRATSSLAELVAHSRGLVIGLASSYISRVEALTSYSLSLPVLSLTKAMLSQKASFFVSDYLQACLPQSSIAVLSGPNLALELAQSKPAATVIASKTDAAGLFQSWLSNGYFRVYKTHDSRGVECGGFLKNVMAIAAGAIEGSQLGENAKAALITRGLQEMIRFGTLFGADEKTFFGLSGLGDLLATCHSDKSRNWRVGFQLAQSKSLDAILSDLGAVAEGVHTASVLNQYLKQEGLSFPIMEEVYAMLFEGKTLVSSLQTLMSRKLKSE